jgi:hypothetical protein
MAANRSNTAARLEPDPQNQPRAWANAVPYDELDQDNDVFHQAAPARNPKAAPTQRLRAVPKSSGPRAQAAQPEADPWLEMPTPAVAPSPKTGRLYEAAPAPHAAANAGTLRLALIGAGALVGVVVLYLVVSAVVHWTQVTMDDLAYGRPRTTHLAAAVGHNNDSPAQPTSFIGLNLNRQVTVFEIPGGDTSKATVINGPYLFGEGEDLTPVQLDTVDVNGDGKLDLMVSVKDEQLVFINDNGSFRAMTAEEKTQLAQPAQGGGPTTGQK